MPVKFEEVSIGMRFNFAGNYWKKANEFEAVNLHNDELEEFLPHEIVIVFEEMK